MVWRSFSTAKIIADGFYRYLGFSHPQDHWGYVQWVIALVFLMASFNLLYRVLLTFVEQRRVHPGRDDRSRIVDSLLLASRVYLISLILQPNVWLAAVDRGDVVVLLDRHRYLFGRRDQFGAGSDP